jgi:hypothetical protein
MLYTNLDLHNYPLIDETCITHSFSFLSNACVGITPRSNMFQHGVRIFLDDYLPIESIDTVQEEEQREYMEDFLYWMRTVWQHIVSHYVRSSFCPVRCHAMLFYAMIWTASTCLQSF